MRETKMKKVLAVVLAFAMVLAMGVMTFAEEAVSGGSTGTPSLEVTSNDGKTVVVTVSTSGMVKSFDYGITYDADKVTFKSNKWNSDFGDAFDNAKGIRTFENQEACSYVVVGGTSPDAEYDGTLTALTFEVKEGATGDLGFSVCENSADIKKAMDAAGEVKPLKDAAGFKAIASVDTPATGKPADPTQAPADPTQAPADPTQAPADPTQAPSGSGDNNQPAPVSTVAPTTAPTTKPATTGRSPKTADTATVVIPMVAIVAAAAAVVVASKKKVED